MGTCAENKDYSKLQPKLLAECNTDADCRGKGFAKYCCAGTEVTEWVYDEDRLPHPRSSTSKHSNRLDLTRREQLLDTAWIVSLPCFTEGMRVSINCQGARLSYGSIATVVLLLRSAVS